MGTTRYVVIDAAEWGSLGVMPESVWDRVRTELLDEWETTLTAAGGDPAVLLADYVHENDGSVDHLLTPGVASGRARREIRSLCRAHAATLDAED